jgi:sugar fermentation stimulation protein A
MKFESPLERGVLQRRYKRFLADVELHDGSIRTIHCPNTGSMKNCANPGDEIWFSTSSNAKRKYPNTWEISRTPNGHFIGIQSARANAIVKEKLHTIPEFAGYESTLSEVKYGQENSRIDLLLREHAEQPDCFIEVKSVTLLDADRETGLGLFPDAVTTRGTKHLRELTEIVRNGCRGVLFYCVQHTGISRVEPASEIDPDYARTLREAIAAGVEVIAYGTKISVKGIELDTPMMFSESA